MRACAKTHNLPHMIELKRLMEKRLSKRSHRRLRLELAKRLVDEERSEPRRHSKKSRLEDSGRPIAEDDSRDLDQSCESELVGVESCSGLESNDDGNAYDLSMNDSLRTV